MRIGLATCKHLPEADDDEALLVSALGAAGLDVELLAWDDDAAQFAKQDLVIVRSTWNYYDRIDDFLGWVERTGGTSVLLNPPGVIAWNARKTYLAELERRDVPIVPTAFVPRGTSRNLSELLSERAWDEVVIKPSVSAASFRTERFARGAASAAQSFLDTLSADRDAMVQKWMPSVETSGERALVWIDGEITHAIRKTPRFAGGGEQVSGDVVIADDERAFAERALAPYAPALLYARVDMVRDEDGTLRLMELELIEPSLYLRHAPYALERFVAATVRRGRAAQENASR